MRPEPLNGRQSDRADVHPRLDSWREIAAYLGKDVRTAMRWERSRGLPVHRLSAARRAPVFALRSEIDDWCARTLPSARWQRAAPAGSEWIDTRQPSLAVLPFDSLSADPDDAELGAGLAADIVSSLSRMPDVRVIGTPSAFTCRRGGADALRAGARLRVAGVLEGTIERDGHRVRIAAQLLDTATGETRWCLRYDHRLGDLFAVKADITHHAARFLAAPFAAPELPAQPPRQQQAYLLGLRGRSLLDQSSGGALLAARAAFEDALQVDPALAAAHLGVAECQFRLVEAGLARPLDAFAAASRSAQRALDLDDTLGEAHALLGATAALLDYDWGRAERHFLYALQLCPGSGTVRHRHAQYVLAPTQRLDRALAQFEAAAGRDPLSPDLHFHIAQLLLSVRRFADAERRVEAALSLEPLHAARWLRAAILSAEGRPQLALSALGRGDAGTESVTALAGRGTVLASLGRPHEARAVLADLRASTRHWVSPARQAWIHVFLGELDDAFACLDRAADDRDPDLVDLAWKWTYDPLRRDPRTVALLRRLHLSAGRIQEAGPRAALAPRRPPV